MKEEIYKKLFENSMKRNWKEVINIYKNNPEARNAKITRSDDTALHIAISDGQESVVEELVAMVDYGALIMKNDVGNTPLHLAAHLGNANMCKCIANREHTLMGIRNKENDTPLFLAVLHGQKEAFLCLDSLCKNSYDRYGYCMGKDGDTILHAAIDGEYFEMAFHIIHHYENLVNTVNKKGFSPLHILASKPAAFRSGWRITNTHQLIYKCIFVDEIILDRSTDPRAEGLEHDNHYIRQHDEESSHQQPVPDQAGPTKRVPDKNTTCFSFLKILSKAMFVILGLGSSRVERMRDLKTRNVWSVQIMRKLVERTSLYEYENNIRKPPSSAQNVTKSVKVYENEEHQFRGVSAGKKCEEVEMEKNETPFLIAAKNGIKEMVEEILKWFPGAINDVNADQKNIVLLAAENCQPHIYEFIKERNIMTSAIFGKRDKDGNSALHLAAMTANRAHGYPPIAALQLQLENQWYRYVMLSMPPNYFVRHNKHGQTPSQIFKEQHKELVKEGGKWLKETSQSCSVVAALIATVAFATSVTIPGGVREENGNPTLQHDAAFSIFAISSLVALCFSVTSIIMFLAILTSSYNERGFGQALRKLVTGFGSLFVSLSAMLVSFCAAHFLIMKEKLKYAAVPLYIVIFIVMTRYVVIQFPWFFFVARLTLLKVPPRIKNFFFFN